MGKGKRKHKNKAKRSTASASGGTDGGIGSSSTIGSGRSEKDILLSLEESLDEHNQTGFVSSYTLPMSSSISTSTDVNISDGHSSKIFSIAEKIEASFSEPIKLTRLESLESNTSKGSEDIENNISDIFRPPSRSPSRSPKSPHSTSAMCSPKDRSIASDSTEATSNLSPIRLPSADYNPVVGVKYPPPSAAAAAAAAKHSVNTRTICSPNQMSIASDSTDATGNLSPMRLPLASPESYPGVGSKFPPPTAAAAAAAKNAIVGNHDIVGNIITASDARDMAGISPLHPTKSANNQFNHDTRINPNGDTPKKTKKKKSSSPKINRNIKKNNLVIQHTPSNLSTRSQNRPHKSSKSPLPPPHPFTNVQSYPPISPPRFRKHHGHSNSIHSMSDASSAASEATPKITPGRRIVPSFSFSSEEDDSVNDLHTTVSADNLLIGGGGGGSLEELPVQIFPSDLKGVDISFADSGDEASDENAVNNGSPDVPNKPLPEFVPPSSPHSFSSVSLSSFKGDSFFAASHTRQFSSDDRFFEGIRESGLQSLSFEEVTDGELSTSREAEIELIHNSSFDNTDSVSIGVMSAGSCFEEDESIENEEDAKKIARKILQWRRGKQLRMNVDLEDGEDQQEDSDCDDYDDAMELAPLTAASPDIHGTNDNSGHRNVFHSSNSTLNWRWKNPLFLIRNYIWRSQLPHHHAVLTTPKKSNMSPIPKYYEADNESDEDESTSLTSPTTHHSRKKSKHYDDVDFDRNANSCCCCFQCCKNDDDRYSDDKPHSTSWQIHSGWKKLLAISSFFLALAWVFSNGKLEKHHSADYSYPGYIYGDSIEDPLARDNFLEKGRIIDDGDDYYTSHPLESPVDDDDLFHLLFSTDDYGNVNNDAEIAANSVNEDHQDQTQQYNNFAGIDTIVVLGAGHTGKDWLIGRLNQLYPEMNVVSGIPTQRSLKTINSSHRSNKIIDPTEGMITNGIDNDSHRKSKSAHILVVAVFLNPYDWVELMHAESHRKMEWKDFVEMELPSINRTVLELRVDNINSAMIESADQDGVKLVIPVQYEELVEPYSNYDNYIQASVMPSTLPGIETLPGIVGLIDKIQARTGLQPESAGWREPSKPGNPFWADPVGCNGHICFQSINKMRKDPGYIQYMNDHVDWHAEKLVGYQKRSVPKPSVDQIVVLGERHSGAEWLVERLSLCFPQIPVKYGFSRPGKWFQTPPDDPISQTLVISIFLNPFDWVELMRQHPINAPTHKGMEWSEFVSSPWERKRSNLDNSLTDTADAKCSFGFSFEEVIPCMTHRDPKSESFPLYELHPAFSSRAGSPFSNLLELRAEKILHFLTAAQFAGVVDFIQLRYEDLVWDEDYTNDASYLALPFPGIAGLLEKIRDQTSLVPDINAGWISDEEGIFKAEPLGVGVTGLDPYYVQWMEDHVDWDAERIVGYNPWHSQ